MHSFTHYRAFALFLLAPATLCAGELALPLEGFAFESKGAYTFRIDERRLAQLRHPFAPSAKGDHGRLVVKTRFPANAKPPFHISFYTSDDHERARDESPRTIATSGGGSVTSLVDEREGHRWKKCWINGEEIWRRDTLEDDAPALIAVPPGIRPGEEFELAFGLEDEADSTERLPGDRLDQARGSHGSYRLDFARYETRSYWGDFTLLWEGSKPPAAQWAPKVDATPPVIPFGMQPGSHRLNVERADALAGPWAWPVEMGIPFAKGFMKKAAGALLGQDGTALASHFETGQPWPDGSVKWGTLHFTATPALIRANEGALNLQLRETPEASPGLPASVSAQGVQSSGLELRASGNGAWTLDAGLARLLEGFHIRVDLEDGPATLKLEKPEVVEKGAWRSTLSVRGELHGGGHRFGHLELRATAFANVPYLRLRLTLLPEGGGVPGIVRYGLEWSTTGPAAPLPNGFYLPGEKQSLVGILKEAIQRGPSRIVAENRRVAIFPFEGNRKLPVLKALGGEAIASEIWLALGEPSVTAEDARRFGDLVDSPPRLDISGLLRESLVWGPLPSIKAGSPVDEKLIAASLRPHFANPLLGVREYGDYKGGILASFYWNAIHTMYTLYATTGERDWADWADRSARLEQERYVNRDGSGGRQAGGIRSRSAADAYNGKLQMVHGLFDYACINGEPETAQLARGVADFLLADPSMQNQIHSRSSRENGWPMLFLVRAWQETGDERYLEGVRAILPSIRKHIDERRGAYRQVHGNQSYPGIVPFMNGILLTALREYHLATGDPQAASMIVRIAWAVYAEMHVPTPGSPAGLAYEYTPNPYRRDPALYRPSAGMNVGIVAGQAYAAILSGDSRLTAIARRGLDAFLDEQKSVNTPAFSYDIAAALYWLERAEALSQSVGLP